MNTLKFALLGTAALAAVSVSAQASTASDIAALKAQINALSAQVAANKTQAELPAGYQMISISTGPASVTPGLEGIKNAPKTATIISIAPTADAPAGTVMEFSGFSRAALIYTNAEANAGYYGAGYPAGLGAPPVPGVLPVATNNIDVISRAQFTAAGRTDTAVGEVGASVTIRGEWNSRGGSNFASTTGYTANTYLSNYWGYWKMTPELTLAAGYNGSLAGIGYGYDGACSCYGTDFARSSFGNRSYSTTQPYYLNTGWSGDTSQMRLSYASGPMSAAIAVEDYRNNVTSSTLGFAGEVKYSGDMLSGEVSGGYWGTPDVVAFPQASYVIAAGLKFALADVATISAAAGLGSGHATLDDYWTANVLASVNLSEQAHVEIGFNHTELTQAVVGDQNAVLAGMYYEPVKQLTIGVEGEWINSPDVANSTAVAVDLVTVFRF